MSEIRFDPSRKLFLIELRSSFYALRVSGRGELFHLGSGPLPEGFEGPLEFDVAETFGEPDVVWDRQLQPYEYPALGDVNYHETAIRAIFREPGSSPAPGEVFSGTVRDLRPRYVSHEILLDAIPGFAPRHGLPTRVNSPRQTLAILLRDEVYAFEIRLFYRVCPEHDVLERWVEVRNGTGQAVKLERLDFACVNLPLGTTQLIYLAGTWSREFFATEHTLTQGVFTLEQMGLNTGHAYNPFFMLRAPEGAGEESGTVWFGSLAFSGNWSLRFERMSSDQIRVFGGYGVTDFAIELAPGESHRTPAMIFGCSPEGFGGASRRLHRFARERVLPATGRETRPVLYNSWEATYFEVNETNQLALAEIAASLGVELFCVDDGWFGARSTDKAGLGDWWPRPGAFPKGIKPFADAVHALGMRFGLWVEPEMVNPDSDLYRAHPDWVLHYPGRPRTEVRSQLILDFGRPEVVETILGCLDRLVAENGIDFFKWDMNRYASEPGSVAGREIWRAHVRGLYRIMDELRRRHPNLDIQSCSGGGGRVDLGILGRCDQAWTSDNTDAHDRTRIQDGFSLAYPARAMECWVTHEKNHQTGRRSTLDLRFDVSMRGALGIGTVLTDLDEEERASYRRKIAFYKQIRPIVQDGDLYRIDVVAKSGASIWLFVSPDRRSAVFSSVVLENPIGRLRGPFVLRGLNPAARYKITDENGVELARSLGGQLMTLGLPDNDRCGSVGGSIRSRTLLLEAL